MDVTPSADDAAVSALTVPQRYDRLYALFSSERFLKLQGIGNEVPFYICPYPPQEAVAMQRLAHQLAGRLAVEKGIQVLEIDLYDLSVELLQERGIWEQLLEVEPDTPKDALLETLQNVLDPETHLVPAIADKMGDQQYDILLLTGVGEIFPYIRSHNVLNNLQRYAKLRPTVLFFPGRYVHSLEKGASLDLFGVLHDDKYYRAFNVYHIEV
jgi:hypothetical protein